MKYVDFYVSQEERDFYQSLHTRSTTQIRGFVESGVNFVRLCECVCVFVFVCFLTWFYLITGLALSKYIQILTLLLRLRQTCNHPFLVIGMPKSVGSLSISWIIRAGKKRLGAWKSRCKNSFFSKITFFCLFVYQDIKIFVSKYLSRSGVKEMPTHYIKEIEQKLKKSGDDRDECPICLFPPEYPVITECGHVFCRECITQACSDKGNAVCPKLTQIFFLYLIFF